MKTLVLLSLVTLAFAEPTRTLDKVKDKRTPVGQSALNGGGGSGGSYSTPSGSYGAPSSQYSTPSSSQYSTPSSSAYLPQFQTNYGTPGGGYGSAGFGYGVPSLAYLPSQMYTLPTINLPLTTGGAYAHGPAGSAGDLSGLFQHGYFLQPTVHSLFTPQLDFGSLYPGLTSGYQQFAAIPAPAGGSQVTGSKLGPVTFGVGHGGLADLAAFAAPQVGQASYSSPTSSYSAPASSAYSAAGSSSGYPSGSQTYSSLPSTYSSPTNSYSSPTNSYSSPSSYSSSGSSYSPSYSAPSSSSYSSPSSSYGGQSSSGYNTINYSKP